MARRPKDRFLISNLDPNYLFEEAIHHNKSLRTTHEHLFEAINLFENLVNYLLRCSNSNLIFQISLKCLILKLPALVEIMLILQERFLSSFNRRFIFTLIMFKGRNKVGEIFIVLPSTCALTCPQLAYSSQKRPSTEALGKKILLGGYL